MLRTVAVFLATLLIAAHFLRTGALFLVLLCLLAPALLWVRTVWAPRALRILLVLASLEWLRTLWGNVVERQGAGEPWVRMALILGAVALLTALAALGVRARVDGAASVPAGPPDAEADAGGSPADPVPPDEPS